MNDGVSLVSAAHPPPSGWAWFWWHVWLRWRAPRLNPASLEMIEIRDPYDDVGRQYLDSMLRSARHSRNTYETAVLMGWSSAETQHYIDTGEQPAQRTSMNDDNEIEKEIQAKGLTAPRVTLAQIESTVAYELYVTGDQLLNVTTPVLGLYNAQVPTMVEATPLNCLTLCVLVLKNGFTVTGENACASPENFDAALGRKVARQKAIDKVWSLEGYALKERLSAAAQGV